MFGSKWTVRAESLPRGHDLDVPRNNLGWPTVEPAAMTMKQLLAEAQHWVATARSAPGCVGDGEFKKYASELVRQQYLDELDVRQWRRDGVAPVMVYEAPNLDFPEQKRWIPHWEPSRQR